MIQVDVHLRFCAGRQTLSYSNIKSSLNFLHYLMSHQAHPVVRISGKSSHKKNPKQSSFSAFWSLTLTHTLCVSKQLSSGGKGYRSEV